MGTDGRGGGGGLGGVSVEVRQAMLSKDFPNSKLFKCSG